MKKLGFGLMRLPQTDSNNSESVDIEALKRMADAFLENGFTYFDTAYVYHNGCSETAFREAVVKRHPREAYTIADKLPMFAISESEQIPSIFEEQLKRCGVEFFDYYLLHSLGKGTYKLSEQLSAFDFVAKKKAEGKIRNIGFSFHDKADLLDEILTKHPEMEFVQLQINYLDWEDSSIESRKCYEVAVKHGKPIIVMEPVKGGSLANIPKQAEDMFKAHSPEMSVASWAVRYAVSLDNVMVVLSGMSNQVQLIDNMSYMHEFKPLTKEEHNIISSVTAIIKGGTAIPCTACRYCVDTCPQKIAIPEYFSAYNNLKQFASQNIVAATYYSNIAQRNGKASDCSLCGTCEEHCPQHLPIREHLKSVAAALE